MEAILVAVVIACLGCIFWILQTIASEHRVKLNESKPRIVGILEARVCALERGESSSNITNINTDELLSLSKYLPLIRRLKLENAIKQYSTANVWSTGDGFYVPKNPANLLASCKKILNILV